MGLFPLKGRSGFLGQTRGTLSELQALAEHATRAATATLEKLTQTAVSIERAGVVLVPRAKLAAATGDYVGTEIAARFPLSGPAPGTVATLFSKQDALELVALLMGRDAGSVKKIGDLERSAVAEMTNIALNGAVTAIAEHHGVRFHTGVPVVETKLSDAGAFFGFDAPGAIDHAVLVESRFLETTRGIHGVMVLVFGVEGAREE